MTEVVPQEYNIWGPKTKCPYDTRQVEEVDKALGFKSQEIVYFHDGENWRLGKITKIGNKAVDPKNGQQLTVFVVKGKDKLHFKTLKELQKKVVWS